jgi:hypothetical protein
MIQQNQSSESRKYRQAYVDSGLRRHTNATIFRDMTLVGQKVPRAVNVYETAGCHAVAACFKEWRPLDEKNPHYVAAWCYEGSADPLEAAQTVLYESKNPPTHSFSVMGLPPAFEGLTAPKNVLWM